jgi:anti-sigma factor RsiW
MNDMWKNRLSEYIDGELDSAETKALEEHLERCGTCYATLGELRQVVARAKALPDTSPTTDLWAGIRAGITEQTAVRQTHRRFSFSVPQLLAASVALMLLSGGGAWLASRSGQRTTPLPPDFSAAPTRRPQLLPVDARMDAAIADLQTALAQNENRLDTTTVRIVRQNLAIIDRAIADARIALQKDPGNAYLNLHLANTMRRKVELLRRVNDLAAAQL